MFLLRYSKALSISKHMEQEFSFRSADYCFSRDTCYRLTLAVDSVGDCLTRGPRGVSVLRCEEPEGGREGR